MQPVYKNILLVNAWSADVFPCVPIGYLQAAIKNYFKNNITVTARDLQPAIELLSKPNDYDLICITFHSFSVRYARQFRELTKGKTIVCGGHHPSALPKQMAGIGYDHIVIGQGENALIDIILGNQTGLYVKANKEYYNINDYPYPDYSGLSISNNTGYGFPIISSRGCPFKCNFCASSLFWNRKTFLRSPVDVVWEINKTLAAHKGTFFFEDDNFTLSPARAITICQGIKNTGMNAKWQCGSRAESLSDPLLCKALLEAGCHAVWLGVESFSQAALDRCEKNTTVEKMVAGIQTAEGLGLKTMCQLIAGLPEDTESDIRATANVIKSLKISRWGCNIAWILPNTKIHEKALQYGFDNNTYLNGGEIYYTYEQNMATLQRWVQIINNAKV